MSGCGHIGGSWRSSREVFLCRTEVSNTYCADAYITPAHSSHLRMQPPPVVGLCAAVHHQTNTDATAFWSSSSYAILSSIQLKTWILWNSTQTFTPPLTQYTSDFYVKLSVLSSKNKCVTASLRGWKHPIWWPGLQISESQSLQLNIWLIKWNIWIYLHGPPSSKI